eukprot:8351078-Pyramimonas_sp.AAC.1
MPEFRGGPKRGHEGAPKAPERAHECSYRFAFGGRREASRLRKNRGRRRADPPFPEVANVTAAIPPLKADPPAVDPRPRLHLLQVTHRGEGERMTISQPFNSHDHHVTKDGGIAVPHPPPLAPGPSASKASGRALTRPLAGRTTRARLADPSVHASLLGLAQGGREQLADLVGHQLVHVLLAELRSVVQRVPHVGQALHRLTCLEVLDCLHCSCLPKHRGRAAICFFEPLGELSSVRLHAVFGGLLLDR